MYEYLKVWIITLKRDFISFVEWKNVSPVIPVDSFFSFFRNRSLLYEHINSVVPSPPSKEKKIENGKQETLKKQNFSWGHFTNR